MHFVTDNFVLRRLLGHSRRGI